MKPAAKAHFDRGLTSYNIQDYAAAIEEFKAGYQIDPRPEFLYALAQAQRLSGNCRSAIDAYRAFLRTNPPAKHDALAKGHIESCESTLAAQTPSPSGESSSSDHGVTSAPRLEPAERASGTTDARPAGPARQEGPPTRRSWYEDGWGNVLMAVGLVGVGAGVPVWAVGYSAASSVQSADNYDSFAKRTDDARGSRTEQAVGVVGVVAGTVCIAAAILHYAHHSRP